MVAAAAWVCVVFKEGIAFCGACGGFRWAPRLRGALFWLPQILDWGLGVFHVGEVRRWTHLVMFGRLFPDRICSVLLVECKKCMYLLHYFK